MLTEYIEEALRRARYELIDDPDTPYFGEIPDLPGVWASADSLEGCRQELKDTVEGWILLSVRYGFAIPKLGDYAIAEIAEMVEAE
jgi:predicted RNase H-like HicB family nuclease